MLTNIHGILAIEDEAPDGIIVIAGANIESLNLVYARRTVTTFYDRPEIGNVKLSRKILSRSDCKDTRDEALFDVARGKPFIRVDCAVNSPPDLLKNLFFWPSGTIMDREGELLTRTVLRAVTISQKDSHLATRVFLG